MKYYKTKNLEAKDQFNYEQAEADLLNMTATTQLKGTLWCPSNTIKPGQVIYPIKLFCKKWNWCEEEVLEFLSELDSKSKIELSQNNNIISITIITYGSNSF